MSALTAATLTLDAYLIDPQYEHCEYVDGQAIEIKVGNLQHSRIQMRIGRYLDEYFDRNPIGFGGTESRARVTAGRRERYRLPDVCAVLFPHSPDGPFVDHSPELVVEIKSPGDSFSHLFQKMTEYIAAGSRLGWMVIPEDRSVFVFKPEQFPAILSTGETLLGDPVFPGLAVAVDDIFR